MPRTPFIASTPYEAAHPNALALYCSDGRFTHSVEELLRSLGHARLDTLTMPGGPGLFNLWIAGMNDSTAIAAAARFLIEGHRLQRVIVIAHDGCGYYRKHFPGHPPAEVRQRQEDDLRIASRALEHIRSGVRVDAFYARVVEGRVAFEPVGRHG
jgi:hypothetical protein